MKFVKMEGLGNDFVLFEGPLQPAVPEIVAWCDRRRGIGADGVLVATRLDSQRVRMEYWNADGGRAEMCGNGLRCVARFAYDRGWTDGRSFTVETDLGDHPVKAKRSGRVRALLARVEAPDQSVISVVGAEVRPMGMGNPHAVLIVENTTEAPVKTLGPVIEVAEQFPDRTNVEFVEIKDRGRIEVRTWERGVGETLACGSGACAVGVVSMLRGVVDREVRVELRGGDLTIRWEADDASVLMTGPAAEVFTGRIPAYPAA